MVFSTFSLQPLMYLIVLSCIFIMSSFVRSYRELMLKQYTYRSLEFQNNCTSFSFADTETFEKFTRTLYTFSDRISTWNTVKLDCTVIALYFSGGKIFFPSKENTAHFSCCAQCFGFRIIQKLCKPILRPWASPPRPLHPKCTRWSYTFSTSPTVGLHCNILRREKSGTRYRGLDGLTLSLGSFSVRGCSRQNMKSRKLTSYQVNSKRLYLTFCLYAPKHCNENIYRSSTVNAWRSKLQGLTADLQTFRNALHRILVSILARYPRGWSFLYGYRQIHWKARKFCYDPSTFLHEIWKNHLKYKTLMLHPKLSHDGSSYSQRENQWNSGETLNVQLKKSNGLACFGYRCTEQWTWQTCCYECCCRLVQGDHPIMAGATSKLLERKSIIKLWTSGRCDKKAVQNGELVASLLSRCI